MGEFRAGRRPGPGGAFVAMLWLLLWLWLGTALADTNRTTFFPQQNLRDEFFDPCVGLEAALLSRLVYGLDEDPWLETLPDAYGSSNASSVWFDEGSTEVLVSLKPSAEEENGPFSAIPPGSGVVTFRGSEEIADWIVNVDQVKVPFGSPNHTIDYPMFQPASSSGGAPERVEVLAHRGFNRVFRLYDDVLGALDEVGYDPLSGAELYVQGHSLGGANALLFAIKYAFDHPATPVRVSTFGAPRAGGRGLKLFAERLRNLVVWRSVFRNDVVPRVPFDGFEHAGHLLWNQAGSAKAFYRQIGDRSRNLGGIQDFSVAVLRESIPENLIGDHSMAEYVPWMESACENPSSGAQAFQTLS